MDEPVLVFFVISVALSNVMALPFAAGCRPAGHGSGGVRVADQGAGR